MHVLLGNLPREKSVNPQRHGLFEVTLSASATPRDAGNIRIGMADDLRGALQGELDKLGELLQGLRLRQYTVHGNVLFAEAALFNEAEHLGELCVVAQFGMGIQR